MTQMVIFAGIAKFTPQMNLNRIFTLLVAVIITCISGNAQPERIPALQRELLVAGNDIHPSRKNFQFFGKRKLLGQQDSEILRQY